MKKLALIAVIAAISPLAAQAESNFVVGAGALSASARLDFTVTIPKVLFLQVGAGTSYANNATINNLTFAVPAGNVGNGTAVAGTGGDLAGGGVTVRVLGNSGTVTLTNATTGQLSSGVVGNPTIPWTDIAVTTGALAATTPGFTNAAIAHPTFNNAAGGGTSAAPTTLTATAGLVRREASWTFAYANTATLPAGTYGGAGATANNARVTYTATAP
ncbi:MAG: hypothetical protein KKC79_06880 [Gammaproteobacteria bacterium]|nr:hypothetical protein [Gammaproteobacteria bacterium]MBU1441551.1 hypothetical protein [Gammaproteobacteria bacterium]MBU2285265.1 hypothetical protein [Gammaproteobacteria bacterium]MBU2408359.1 hypothetical protein [Gammaproteobacteria bacterium]